MAKWRRRHRQYVAAMRMAKRTENGEPSTHDYWVTMARQVLAAIARRTNRQPKPVEAVPA